MLTESQFMDAQEDICERFAADELTLDEGVKLLRAIGFWEDEARTMLQECI